MKRITSILAALLLLLGATTTVSAANHGDITGMAHDLSYGYSGDSDLGDVAPQDGLVSTSTSPTPCSPGRTAMPRR